MNYVVVVFFFRCDQKCAPGFYGIDCKLKCNCMNGAECNFQYGTCDCTAGII